MVRVESSVLKILDSQIVKIVDDTINLIDNKFKVNETGNKILDVVEEKTETLVEKGLDYYLHGKEIVEKGKNIVEEKKEMIVENGHEIYDDKIKQMNVYYSSGKKTLDEKKEEFFIVYKKRMDEYKKAAEEIKKIGEDMYMSGKVKVMDVVTNTKEEYYDKPQKLIADILQSKYESLKEKYPTTVKIVDEFYVSGKKVAEEKKDKAVEVYSKTCKYYNDQKEAVKKIGEDLMKHANEYIRNLEEEGEENRGGDADKKPDLKEIGYEMLDFTKQEMANVTKRYLIFAHRYYEAIKLKLSQAPTQEEEQETVEESKQ
jgi:hypothetical protein